MSRIIGTDIDLSGGLPVSSDPGLRQNEVQALIALLGTAETPKDPAVAEMLRRINEQLIFVGSSDSAIDSDGPESEVTQDTDSDISTGADDTDADSTELTAEATMLAKLKADFDRGIRLIGADRSVKEKPTDLTWEKVEARLLAENGAGLKKASEMQGGGELFGVDEQGRLLIKDRGNEPVMFGFDKTGKAIMIYDRDENQMAQLAEEGARVANYYEIYEAVYGPEGKPTGYELFPDAPDYEKKGAIAAVEEVTQVPFVKSANGNEWRASWLDSGRNPDRNAYARDVRFGPGYQRTYVRNDYPYDGRDGRGAVRLLRV